MPEPVTTGIEGVFRYPLPGRYGRKRVRGAWTDRTDERDDVWNAGELGCGELLIELRRRLRAMPGGVLHLVALDPGAPEDIPSYCRVTRNELVRHDPDSHSFWIRSRLDWA